MEESVINPTLAHWENRKQPFPGLKQTGFAEVWAELWASGRSSCAFWFSSSLLSDAVIFHNSDFFPVLFPQRRYIWIHLRPEQGSRRSCETIWKDGLSFSQPSACWRLTISVSQAGHRVLGERAEGATLSAPSHCSSSTLIGKKRCQNKVLLTIQNGNK